MKGRLTLSDSQARKVRNYIRHKSGTTQTALCEEFSIAKSAISMYLSQNPAKRNQLPVDFAEKLYDRLGSPTELEFLVGKPMPDTPVLDRQDLWQDLYAGYINQINSIFRAVGEKDKSEIIGGLTQIINNYSPETK